MKIAVWSPTAFAGRKSANLLLLALQSIAQEEGEQLILHADAAGSGPEHFLLSGSCRRRMMERKEFGLEFLVELMRCERFSKELAINASYTFADGKLHVLPAGSSFFYQGNEEKAAAAVCNIMQHADAVFQNVWIELPAGNSVFSQQIFSQADCVIVNLAQSSFEMSKIETLPKFKNPFYLVGAYEQRTIYSVHNMELLYPALRRKCASVPYDSVFLEACCRGNAEDFWRREISKRETGAQSAFGKSVEQVYGKWKEGRRIGSCGEEKCEIQNA